jgi:hypothetical protein
MHDVENCCGDSGGVALNFELGGTLPAAQKRSNSDRGEAGRRAVGAAVEVVTPSSSAGYSATGDMRLLSKVIGIGIETADMLVQEIRAVSMRSMSLAGAFGYAGLMRPSTSVNSRVIGCDAC